MHWLWKQLPLLLARNNVRSPHATPNRGSDVGTHAETDCVPTANPMQQTSTNPTRIPTTHPTLAPRCRRVASVIMLDAVPIDGCCGGDGGGEQTRLRAWEFTWNTCIRSIHRLNLIDHYKCLSVALIAVLFKTAFHFDL